MKKITQPTVQLEPLIQSARDMQEATLYLAKHKRDKVVATVMKVKDLWVFIGMWDCISSTGDLDWVDDRFEIIRMYTDNDTLTITGNGRGE